MNLRNLFSGQQITIVQSYLSKEVILAINFYFVLKAVFLYGFRFGIFLMIETLQWFHWHEQHMFKVDPNISITHPSHLLSQILYKVKILN